VHDRFRAVSPAGRVPQLITSPYPTASGSEGVRERVESGIDLEPAGREIVGDLEQRLELIERLLQRAN
jgi:hypothetical protein